MRKIHEERKQEIYKGEAGREWKGKERDREGEGRKIGRKGGRRTKGKEDREGERKKKKDLM